MLKYIVGTRFNCGFDEFFAFSSTINHLDCIRGVRIHTPKGAGFFTVDEYGEFSCFGESITPSVVNRGRKDAVILQNDNKVKYVVGKRPNCEHEDCFVFSNTAEHKYVATAMRLKSVSSAGFIYIASNNKICCHGRSESIGIESRPETDSKIIAQYLNDK